MSYWLLLTSALLPRSEDSISLASHRCPSKLFGILGVTRGPGFSQPPCGYMCTSPVLSSFGGINPEPHEGSFLHSCKEPWPYVSRSPMSHVALGGWSQNLTWMGHTEATIVGGRNIHCLTLPQPPKVLHVNHISQCCSHQLFI